LQIFRRALRYLHCYIIYIHRIYRDLFDKNSLFTQMTYAYITRFARFAHLAVQRHLNEIGRWANEWRININVEKTKAVIFSKRTRLQLPVLELHEEDIEYVPSCPYLGVILDRRMNWKPHVEVPRGKAHGSLTALSQLLRSSLSSRDKLLLYKTPIRPTMTYAALAWAFTTNRSMLRLQAVQNRALRLIGGYDRYTRNDVMHSDLEIVKLKSFMKHLSLKLYMFLLKQAETSISVG
jgi:hypothetical protein